MKKRYVFPICVSVMLGIFSLSYAADFQNGSFEEGPADIGSYVTLSYTDGVSEAIPGWVITTGSIDLIGAYWEASDGDRSIDLSGDNAGIISQTFDTEPGALYQVLFDMAGNPDSPGLKVLVMTANSTTTTYEFDSTEKSKDAMDWTEMTFLFQANGPLTTLEFASANLDSPYGPALDNIRVIKIRLFPEDIMHPTGAVHVHNNLLWPPNNKMVPVKIEGYVLDELSMARDEEGIGVSKAYLVVNGQTIILRDKTIDLLNPDGSFSIVKCLKAKKCAKYTIELWAADTNTTEAGGPNEGLVDSTFVQVPHDMSGKDNKCDDDGDQNCNTTKTNTSNKKSKNKSNKK